MVKIRDTQHMVAMTESLASDMKHKLVEKPQNIVDWPSRSNWPIDPFQQGRREAPVAEAVNGQAGWLEKGGVNWVGLRTLYSKEVRRFLKVLPQTILAPVITALLFAVVFKLALSSGRAPQNGVAYEYFLAPGLIMMQILQNSFMNSSSSLMTSKVQGNIVDVLMPPLSPTEVTAAFIMGGVTRGMLVGAVTTLALLILPFKSVMISHVWAIFFYSLIASLITAGLGVMTGIWAEKFDHMAVATTFVITPLTFLSGTFYSVDRLGPVFAEITHWNPFFLLIDGFRYGFIGTADSRMGVGMVVLTTLTVLVVIVCQRMFATGYRLKS